MTNNPGHNDQFIAQVTDKLALLYDREVGQWILTRDKRHTKSATKFEKFAFWTDGLDKLGREVRRRQGYMRLSVPEVTLKTLPLDYWLLSKGLPTADEAVFG